MSKTIRTYEVVLNAKADRASTYTSHSVIVQAENKSQAVKQASAPFHKVKATTAVYDAAMINR
jgi:hypothetical protein